MKLKAENILKKYSKKTVAENINIQINKAEVVGLLGPNGAGKTTIFKIFVGILQPDSGKIYLNGKDITNLPMYKRAQLGIAYLPQEPSIFRKLTVEQNLTIITEMLPLNPQIKKNKVETLLNDFGLIELKSQRAYTLSGGEKRRLEIARALLTSPNFLLLDEPFIGIDPITVVEIQNIVTQLKNKNIGILITDHNVRETLQIIDRAYIIHQGKILLEGDAKTLINSPEARKVYLGEEFKV